MPRRRIAKCSNASVACYAPARKVRVTQDGVRARTMRLCATCRTLYREDGFKVVVIES